MKRFTLLFFLIGALRLSAQSPINITLSTYNATCYGQCNGMLSASVTGNTGPCSYLWMPGGQTTASISNLCAGTYTVQVTDSIGYTGTAIGTINQPPPFTITVNSATVCYGGYAQLACTPGGGMSPYVYSWSPVSSLSCGSCASPTAGPLLATTSYTVTMMDAMGCTATAGMTVYVDPQISTSMTAVETSCNMSTGSATMTPTGGSGVFAYTWNTAPPQTTSTATGLATGSYVCTVVDANGCLESDTIFVGDSCDFVWPGDANDDAVADNTDILDIGIANGATGTPRANATLNWIGQPSANWGTTLLSGTDYKFVDCNGDGIIDPNDTTAVIQNFGLVHNNRIGQQPYNASLPDLQVVIQPDTLGSGTGGSLQLMLGTTQVPVSNLYGIAFTLNYDAAQVDPASLGLNLNSSWLGTAGTDMMGVRITPGTGGQTAVAITRLDHQDRTGSGLLGSMSFQTTSTLTGTGNGTPVAFTVSNVTAISANETTLGLNTLGDTVTVFDNNILLGITENAAASTLQFWPNPTSTSAWLNLPAGKPCTVELFDATGRKVLSETGVSGNYEIRCAHLAPGLYECRVLDGQRLAGRGRLVVKP